MSFEVFKRNKGFVLPSMTFDTVIRRPVEANECMVVNEGCVYTIAPYAAICYAMSCFPHSIPPKKSSVVQDQCPTTNSMREDFIQKIRITADSP